MRQIKFRAWMKDNGVLLSVTEIDFHQDGIYIGGKAINDTGVHRYYYEGISYLEMELEQYTGLKDKNGKEIYEGDIIRIFGYKGDITEEGDVFWCIHSLRWKVDIYGFTADNDIEMIGNIHENPELL